MILTRCGERSSITIRNLMPRIRWRNAITERAVELLSPRTVSASIDNRHRITFVIAMDWRNSLSEITDETKRHTTVKVLIDGHGIGEGICQVVRLFGIDRELSLSRWKSNVEKSRRSAGVEDHAHRQFSWQVSSSFRIYVWCFSYRRWGVEEQSGKASSVDSSVYWSSQREEFVEPRLDPLSCRSQPNAIHRHRLSDAFKNNFITRGVSSSETMSNANANSRRTSEDSPHARSLRQLYVGRVAQRIEIPRNLLFTLESSLQQWRKYHHRHPNIRAWSSRKRELNRWQTKTRRLINTKERERERTKEREHEWLAKDLMPKKRNNEVQSSGRERNISNVSSTTCTKTDRKE